MVRRSCCRHDQTAERIRDDWESGNVARKRTTPESVLATPEAIAAAPRPTVLKRRIGTGSEGVRLIRERSELAGLASEAWLLQEFLQHPQLTANSFLNRTTGAFHSAAICSSHQIRPCADGARSLAGVSRPRGRGTGAEIANIRHFFRSVIIGFFLALDDYRRVVAGRRTAAFGADFTIATWPFLQRADRSDDKAVCRRIYCWPRVHGICHFRFIEMGGSRCGV